MFHFNEIIMIEGNWGQYGWRIPAIFTKQQVLQFRSSVDGNHDYKFDYNFQLNTVYLIEIIQAKQNNVVTYKIRINNATVHSHL